MPAPLSKPRRRAQPPHLRRAAEPRARAAASTSSAGEAVCTCAGVWRTRRGRPALRPGRTARSERSRAEGTPSGEKTGGAGSSKPWPGAQAPHRAAGPARRGRGRRTIHQESRNDLLCVPVQMRTRTLSLHAIGIKWGSSSGHTGARPATERRLTHKKEVLCKVHLYPDANSSLARPAV